MLSLPPSLWGLPIQWVIFALVLLLVVAIAPLVSGGSYQSKIRQRASKLNKRMHPKEKKASKQTQGEQRTLRRQEGDASLPLFTSLLNHLPNISVLRARLARGGLSISAERYLFLNVVVMLITMVLLVYVLGQGIGIALLLSISIGIGIPHMIVGFLIGRRTKRFLSLFPDAIDLIVRGLRAGLPVTESIKMVAKEIEDPVGSVFQSMADKMALGIPLEQTLYDTARKYRITEFDFFVTSIALQRETGGNLSEILNNLSEALRQRLMMQLKIKAMSSEAKASMYIIAALPFVVALALLIVSPQYLMPLFDDYRGNIALAIAGGMLGIGVTIMTRMTKFEI